MRTSDSGVAFIQRHEGVVLRAYRDPAGVWTIGAGLTAASGVVDPRPGMEITQAEADALLTRALGKYEARVNRAMPNAPQAAFDGGVSFDFNTGAIHRASWVPAWASGNMAAMRERLGRWNKGGGRVLPGLTRRRAEEADLIEHASYGPGLSASAPRGLASMALDLSADEIAAAREAFRTLGFNPGGDGRGITRAAVIAFQRRHDLTVDGILGRATLSALQRRLNARRDASVGGTVAASGGAETVTGVLPENSVLAFIGPTVLIVGLIGMAWVAWRYRDAIAAKLTPSLPRVAALFRSIK